MSSQPSSASSQNATARFKLRVNAAPATPTPSTPLDDAKKNGVLNLNASPNATHSNASSSPKPKAKMVLRPTPEQQEREAKMDSEHIAPTRLRSATPIPTAYVARPDTSIRMIAEGDEEEGESDPSVPQPNAFGLLVASNDTERRGIKFSRRSRPDVDFRSQNRTATESSLTSKMRARPTRADLERRGVLDRNSRRVAPSLASAAIALDRAQRADMLTNKMRVRPERHHHVLRTIVEDTIPDRYEAATFGTGDSEEARKAKLQAILNKKIGNRPDREQLQKKNILRGGGAGGSGGAGGDEPTLSQVLDERRGKLNLFIGSRPNRGQLVNRNILSDKSVDAARERRDSLSRLIANRPTRSQLKDRGILDVERVAPRLAAATRSLKQARHNDLARQKLHVATEVDSNSLSVSEKSPSAQQRTPFFPSPSIAE